MVGERIPICAIYLMDNAAPYLANAFTVAVQDDNWVCTRSFFNEIIDLARDTIDDSEIERIMGETEDVWTWESCEAAVRLSREALAYAVRDRALMDRRRTTQSRYELIRTLALRHISSWAKDRGIQPNAPEYLFSLDIGEIAQTGAADS
jgi:hypothetical protein